MRLPDAELVRETVLRNTCGRPLFLGNGKDVDGRGDQRQGELYRRVSIFFYFRRLRRRWQAGCVGADARRDLAAAGGAEPEGEATGKCEGRKATPRCGPMLSPCRVVCAASGLSANQPSGDQTPAFFQISSSLLYCASLKLTLDPYSTIKLRMFVRNSFCQSSTCLVFRAASIRATMASRSSFVNLIRSGAFHFEKSDVRTGGAIRRRVSRHPPDERLLEPRSLARDGSCKSDGSR